MAITTTHNTYGIPINLSIKKSVTSKYKKKNGLTYPWVAAYKTVTGGTLQTNTSQAGYASPSYGTTLIRNNLRQLLLTEKGERVMLPNFGLSLKRYVFEPLDETTFFLLRNDILKTLKKYFSIVSVVNLGIYSNENSRNNGELIISLTLQVNDESLDVFDIEVKVTA